MNRFAAFLITLVGIVLLGYAFSSASANSLTSGCQGAPPDFCCRCEQDIDEEGLPISVCELTTLNMFSECTDPKWCPTGAYDCREM